MTQTKCDNCGRVLCDGKERILSANFDSALPGKPMEPGIVWAKCDICYEAALRARMTGPIEQNRIIEQEVLDELDK